MENPMVSNIRKRSSKSRSRSNTPVQKYFLSSSDEVLPDVPAMNTRSSSRQCFVVLEDSVYQKYKTSDYSSEDGDNSIQTDSRSEHIDNRRNGQREQHQKDLLAYKEYHEAGQYWNKFPKTDYTYSKRSPHRRELPDGSVALPNMSRPSLHTFDERMHKKNLAERVTYFERCTKKDYSQLTDESTNVYSTSAPSSSHYRTSEHYVSSRNYNGKDITDVTVVEEEDNGLLSKLWMRVSSAGRWTKSWFVNVEEAETKKYRTPLRHEMNENRGYATRAYGAITSAALRLMTWVYWLIGSVLILDCKLLSGRETPPRSRTRPLVLLVLLPLLLLCAWWLYVHPYEDAVELMHTTTDVLVSLPGRAVDVTTSLAYLVLDVFQSPLTHLTNASAYIFSAASAIVSSAHDILLALPSHLYRSIAYSLETVVQLLRSSGSFLLSSLTAFWYWLTACLLYFKSDETAPKIVEVPFTSSSHYDSTDHQRSDIKLGFTDDDLNRRIDLYLGNYLRNNEFNNYVRDKVVSSPKYVVQITDLIRDELRTSRTQDLMDPGFIERVAVLVKQKLSSEDKPFVLTSLHLRQISDALNNGDLNLNINKFDTSALIQELVKNPLLQNYIVQSSSALNVDKSLMENQQNLLFELEKQIRANKIDIDKLKNSQTNRDYDGGAIEQLQNAVNVLRSQQDLLRDDIVLVQKLGRQSVNDLNAEFRRLLSDILGFDVNNGDQDGFRLWMDSAFVAKDVLEARLGKLRDEMRTESKATVDASSAVLMKHIGDSIKAAILRYSQDQTRVIANLKNEFRTVNNAAFGGIVDLNEFDVHKIVQAALEKYDADKTGLVDYALESAGGQVLSTRCTETFNSRTAQYVWLGIPLWYSTNSPRTAITPGTQPGQCWAFQGFPGYLVLKLSMPLHVTGFTMEHASKLVIANENIDSAPRNFSVWGLQSLEDQEPVLFGYFEYLDNSTSLQYFPVIPTEQNGGAYEIVELRIESNHGNPVFSCLYRFRVHGNPQMDNMRSTEQTTR